MAFIITLSVPMLGSDIWVKNKRKKGRGKKKRY
jgi:hypothetical protein